jgi:hypothetical protein
MESSESVSYLALSDFRPVQCGSMIVRRASFGEIEALAGELPMLPQRSYRIGSDQGIVVLVVALERSIAVEVDELTVVLGKSVDRFGVRGFIEGDQGSEGFEDRSAVVKGKRLPRLLIRR